MASVRHQRGKVFGIALCVVLALSVYPGIVGVVSELFGTGFIESMRLSSQSGSKSDGRFAMGDTINVSAAVTRGNFYQLNVYDNNDRLVFEEDGTVKDSDVNAVVPILPPSFNASRTYSLVLDEGVVNTPLLGVGAYDSSSTAFTVVQGLTNLNLTSDYNAVTHELRTVALLTTNDSVPVVNETVSLYMQPDLDVALTSRGWICLGQVLTDANGTALFDVAVNAKGGDYGLQARFAGDNNFESSTSQNATRFVESRQCRSYT